MIADHVATMTRSSGGSEVFQSCEMEERVLEDAASKAMESI